MTFSVIYKKLVIFSMTLTYNFKYQLFFSTLIIRIQIKS